MLSIFTNKVSLESLKLKAAVLTLAACMNIVKAYAQDSTGINNSTIVPETTSSNYTTAITLAVVLPTVCICLGLCIYNLKQRFNDLRNYYRQITNREEIPMSKI